MSFAVLEKQVAVLPQELQDNIEMYARFVINQFKNGAYKEKCNNDLNSKKNFVSKLFSISEKEPELHKSSEKWTRDELHRF